MCSMKVNIFTKNRRGTNCKKFYSLYEKFAFSNFEKPNYIDSDSDSDFVAEVEKPKSKKGKAKKVTIISFY